MQELVTATVIMGGLGAFFGLGLAVAHRFLRVAEDPRLEVVTDRLPGSNCGACGQAGCRAFAETLLQGVNAPSRCSVAGADVVDSIAAFLGVDPGQAERRVARLHCAGGISAARQIAAYEGYSSCSAAHLVGGGGKGCSWGCLGLADCDHACDFDAITMNAERLPVVNVATCTACGDCVTACPRDLFEILPIGHALLVQCNAPLEGEAARAVCRVACDGCGRCAADAAPGLVRMENNLPIVDYGAGGPALPAATHRCPTGAIRWVADGQFATSSSPALTGDRLD